MGELIVTKSVEAMVFRANTQHQMPFVHLAQSAHSHDCMHAGQFDRTLAEKIKKRWRIRRNGSIATIENPTVQ